MPNEPKKSRKPLAILAVVLVLCGLAAWLVIKSRRAQTPNAAPIAALRLDHIDETNRVATLSDGGSHDSDGTLRSWRIAWGDGKEESFSSTPQKTAHTYVSEGEYTVSLWCVDNRGSTSSPPAMTNITFDFLKRQKALELAQAEAKREADRLKEEEARKQADRMEQERKKQQELAAIEAQKAKELAAMEAQKAKEQQELEAKRKAEAELARQKASEAATPPPTPLAIALPDSPSSRTVIYTPPGCTLGEFQIRKEGTAGMGKDGKHLVILVTRCVNLPDTAVPTADWQIDGKKVGLQAGRIRAGLSQGRHEVVAFFTPKRGLQPKEVRADVTVEATGECVLIPRE
jgi:hypothetical protein